MIFALLLIGVIASAVSNSWVPFVTASLFAHIIQELMMYDMHRHIEMMEDRNG